MTPAAQNSDPLTALASLVVKAQVSLGGLSEAERQLVLGFVWAGLPQTVMAEQGVNEALRAQLAGAAAFLATDHVELRRWLCDAGWVQRDGYGRAYQRVAAGELPVAQRALADALAAAFADGDTAAYTAGRRAAREAERAARRRAFGG